MAPVEEQEEIISIYLSKIRSTQHHSEAPTGQVHPLQVTSIHLMPAIQSIPKLHPTTPNDLTNTMNRKIPLTGMFSCWNLS